MRHRAVRLTLFSLFVVAVGVGAYVFWINEVRVRGDAEASRAFSRAAVAALVQVHELRSAQQGYVAAGQGYDFWAERVAAIVPALRDSVAALRRHAVSPAAHTTLDVAAESIQAFERMDRRAREYARYEQRLLASDLIYTDGLEVTGQAAAALDEARQVESSERDRAMARGRIEQAGALGGVIAFALLVMAMLVPGGRTAAASSPTSLAVAADPAPAVDLGPLDSGWRTTALPQAAGSVDLAPLAALCTDLARVVDTQALPSILQRAATTLDASGIVVWIADPDGRELIPVLTHGYPQSVITRLGTLLRDAENVTAAAFRTALLQTVKADTMSHGAIAAPIVTAAGCVGVLAAEVRNDGEQDETKRAATAIVAAQLATLVGPPSKGNTSSRPQAAGA